MQSCISVFSFYYIFAVCVTAVSGLTTISGILIVIMILHYYHTTFSFHNFILYGFTIRS